MSNMGQDRSSKASTRPGGRVDKVAAEQARHIEPAQKKSKPVRQRAPSALDVGKGSLEGIAEHGKGFINDSALKRSSGATTKSEQASVRAKGAAEKANKGGSQAQQRPVRVGAGPSLEPGTPLLPIRRGRPQGVQTPQEVQAPKESACAEMEALSSAAAAFEAQKHSLRQSRTPSVKSQAPKQRGSAAAATTGKVHADDLVKMVVGAALNGQQPGALKGQSTQDMQNHLMGSFFAGPGFQLPPTPEALPLPSSSLLQRFGQQ